MKSKCFNGSWCDHICMRNTYCRFIIFPIFGRSQKSCYLFKIHRTYYVIPNLDYLCLDAKHNRQSENVKCNKDPISYANPMIQKHTTFLAYFTAFSIERLFTQMPLWYKFLSISSKNRLYLTWSICLYIFMVPMRNMLVSSIFIRFKLKSFMSSVIKRITLLLSFHSVQWWRRPA